jgi:spermidine dehydrogenase
MTRQPHLSSAERALGMHTAITRRDFLGATLMASGAALLSGLAPIELLAQLDKDDWSGYGAIGEYRKSCGNPREVMLAGHKIRDRAYADPEQAATDTGEMYDCVVVGGGISGLAAALFFQRGTGSKTKCLILDNHPIFGGEAKQNDFEVDGHHLTAHQGSAIYLVPYPYSFIANFYNSIGLHAPKLSYQTWSGTDSEMVLGRTPYDSAGLGKGQYGFWFGAKFGQKAGVWLIDPLGKKMEGAPVSAKTKAELLHWFSGEGREKFARPKYEGDEISRRLDSMTLEEHYIRDFGVSRETIREFLSPVEGGGSGLGPDGLSAYNDYAADMLHPYEAGGDAVQMFPGGNATIARLIVKTLLPTAIDGPLTVEGVTKGSVNFAQLDAPDAAVRMRLSATAISVKHEGDPAKSEAVSLVYEKGGKLLRVRARCVVMAGGSWTTKHIVRDLPEQHRAAYAQFYRSPALMINVAVRNWRFLQKMGMTGCRWFDGVGNYMDVCRKAKNGVIDDTISPDSPVVLTIKALYSYPGESTEQQGIHGRTEMLGTSFRDYERRLRQQLTDMFGAAGFVAQRDIAAIILNRWGHAYLSPQPGFFFGKDGKPAPRETLRSAPFGRIGFANTDLAGAMDHRYSILEAQRAVSQLLDQVFTG